MRPVPLYAWSVSDRVKRATWEGEAPTQAQAKAAVTDRLRAIGRGLRGVDGTVFRPSGGGWFARENSVRGTYSWEAWDHEQR